MPRPGSRSVVLAPHAPPPLQVRHTVRVAREEITAVAAFGALVASGSASGSLRVHCGRSGAQLQSLKLPRASRVCCLQLPAAGATAASCVLAASFSKVHAYAPEYGVLAGEFEPHADVITAMSSAPMPGGTGRLYTASEDTTVKTWPVDAERSPWLTPAPPLFEIDSPGASVPLAVEVRCCACMHAVCNVGELPCARMHDGARRACGACAGAVHDACVRWVMRGCCA